MKFVDLPLRNLQISYDEDSDVLYVSIGEPRPALTYEEDGGVLIRRDPETQKVVGVTVVDYDHRFRALPDVSWLETKGLPSELVSYLKKRPPIYSIRDL